MKNRKKLLTAILVSVLAVAILVAASLALFTDSDTTGTSGQVGTVDIALTGGDSITSYYQGVEQDYTNINPGDGDDNGDPDDPDDPPNPGTDHFIEYEVEYLGNKSADMRQSIIFSAKKANGDIIPMDATDPIFGLSVEDADDPGVWVDISTLSNVEVEYIIDNNGTEDVTTDDIIIGIKYVISDPTVYNGNGVEADGVEKEVDGFGNETDGYEKSYKYKLIMYRDSDNKYQGATVSIDIIVEAKQHRNTTKADWDLIAKKTITTSIGTTENIVPAREEDANGDVF